MRNIIITGGELFNKGAQAMVFITVDELKKRFPNHEIYLLSTEDMKRPRDERDKYAFKFLGWHPQKFAKAQSNPVLRLLCFLRNHDELIECENMYENCDLMVDISGYALGSNWSEVNCNNYLDHIEFAKQFHIPMYLMPQSFGPFDFLGSEGEKILKRCRNLLRYPKAIFVREQEGYEALCDNFRLNNVHRTPDLVLCNIGLELNSVFKEQPVYQIPYIKQGSIGIIPNGMTLSLINEDEVIDIYHSVISQIRGTGSTVYLLLHATQDRMLSQKIKQQFLCDEQVVLLDSDFSCIEFNDIVKQFKYIIGSRFHSIVHAYKNGIPCIVLGWATKYNELLKMFDQGKYMFDLRKGIDCEALKNKIHEMDKNYAVESEKIKTTLRLIQKENVFDCVLM